MTSNKSTCDDVERLFRENDDVGADSSLLLRACRQFFLDGKPIGALTVLAFRGVNTCVHPFGVITHTSNQRVVFWPVLPRNADMIAATGKVGVVDHLTLELPNIRTHVTAYDAAGEPSRASAHTFGHNQAWRLHEFENSGLALWFTMLVRWSVLLDQDFAVQRLVHAPTPVEAERRKEMFAQMASQMNVIDFPLPEGVVEPEYVYCTVCLVVSQNSEVSFPMNALALDHLEGEVEGLPAGIRFEVQVKQLRYEQTQFVLATACPPGKMRQDVTFGLPRRITGHRI